MSVFCKMLSKSIFCLVCYFHRLTAEKHPCAVATSRRRLTSLTDAFLTALVEYAFDNSANAIINLVRKIKLASK